MNTVYVQTSDRNGISLFYGKLKPKKISDYDSSILIEPEYKEIYSFLGFQEHKVPIIDKYYENIKRLAITKNKDIQLYVNNYVLDYILNTIEINSNNLSKYNDIAYYSEQSGLYKEAVYLLEKIIKKYPNRTVAYINLGDSYWGLGKKEEAKEAYKKYVEQMKVNGKEKKIPKRVLQKITE